MVNKQTKTRIHKNFLNSYLRGMSLFNGKWEYRNNVNISKLGYTHKIITLTIMLKLKSKLKNYLFLG